ncbi:ribonuclease p complex subunit [Lasallia pustulata]|uniref:Ribonuclease P protein subunit n=1 Tax=Lasallia pustulata TaxID=136370 RepID=A0A1W5DAU0_9LECA|nr:ribonuclease p complex subunit [Lasallia pustulata]
MTDSPSTSHIARTLLSRAHPPTTANTIFTTKVLQKPLHLRPTSPDSTSQDARTQRRLLRLRKTAHANRKQKPRPLSAKEKRALGVYDIPASARKYDLYVSLHKLWVGYMWEILGLKEGEARGGYVTVQGQGSKLASADFHGAEVQVVRSRCVGRVGCEGIVVKDTKFTFEVITKNNELKTIPKEYTVFRFEIPQPRGESRDSEDAGKKPINLVFELHGSQFMNRATDRATRKFKQRNLSNL